MGYLLVKDTFSIVLFLINKQELLLIKRCRKVFFFQVYH